MTHASRRQGAKLAKYMGLARMVARSIARRVPGYVEKEDLVAAAFLGLADVLTRDFAGTDDEFEKYANIRIHGAVLDELRDCDHLSRDERVLDGRIRAAKRVLAHKLGRLPSSDEVADITGLTLDRLRRHDVLNAAGRQKRIDATECNLASDDHETLLKKLDADSRSALLMKHCARLSWRERVLLEMYYECDHTFAQIGKAMGFTESRACQIHGDSIRKLRSARGIEECLP